MLKVRFSDAIYCENESGTGQADFFSIFVGLERSTHQSDFLGADGLLPVAALPVQLERSLLCEPSFFASLHGLPQFIE